jgi:dipeptidyl aminopeptidase/acylaminoacyl peptidase
MATCDDIYRLAIPSDPRVAPGGDRVAFVVTTADRVADENRSAIWCVDVDGGAPVQLTRGDHDRAPRWSPDGTQLAFLRPTGDDPAQLWLLPTSGGEPRQITTRPSGAGPAYWSPDGRSIAFVAASDLAGDAASVDEVTRRQPVVIERLDYKMDGAGVRRGIRTHIFTLDLADDSLIQVTSGDMDADNPAWSPDGSRLAYIASHTPDRDLVPVRDVFVDTRQVTDGDLYGHVTWTPDGTALIVAGPESQEPGHTRLWRVPAEGGARKELTAGFDRNVMLGAPGYPGAMPTLTADGLLFCARDAGCTHAYVMPVDGGAADKIIGAPDTVVMGLSVGESLVAFVEASPTTPGEIHVAALDGTGDRTLTSLTDVSMFVPQPRVFTSSDGTAVHGWLIRDEAAATPGPLLLDVHGGPHNAWSPVFDGVHLYHQMLVAAGWSVLILNPRGSDGYGEDFYTSVCGGWGVADMDDFLRPLDALVDEGIADPASIALTGYSYGGYTTCWLTARTDRFAAAVAGGAVSNFMSISGTSDLGHLLAEWEIGASAGSPITYVADVTAPTLLLHGEADDRCPIGQSEEWFAALRSRRVETQMVRYPGASHLFILDGRPSHRVDYNRRVAEWVTAHATVVLEVRASD